MQCIKRLEAKLAEHQPHVSAIVIAVMFISVFGLIAPAMLYAQEVYSSSNIAIEFIGPFEASNYEAP